MLALATDGGDSGTRPGSASVVASAKRTIPRIDFLSTAVGARVAIEAEWLTHGYFVNLTFATETSLIDPLPHQRMAVYDVVLPQPRLVASAPAGSEIADEGAWIPQASGNTPPVIAQGSWDPWEGSLKQWRSPSETNGADDQMSSPVF